MSARGGEPDTATVAGLEIARVDHAQVLDRVFSDLAQGRGGWLVTANLDFVQRADESAEMRALYAQADLTVADGFPVVWAARLAGQPLPERVAGSDLVWSLAERAEREGRSIYLLGGEGDSAERARERLIERHFGLRIAGTSSPFLSLPPTAEELEPIRRELCDVRPDIVYVAFGSPKQEYVIDALRGDLPGAWMMGCGISLSFIAGDITRAPEWVQSLHLEWFHRMLQEPGRLAGRYLGRNLPFVFRLLLRALLRRGR